MRGTKLCAAALGLVLTAALRLSAFPNLATDEYYPSEESTERRMIEWPRLVELQASRAVLKWSNISPQTLGVGDRYQGWELVAIISSGQPLAVLERDFPRWGILAYIGTAGPVAPLRKSVGKLDNLPRAGSFPPEYFDKIVSAQEDLLGRKILIKGEDPSYEALAGLLPPLDTYTILGTTTSRQKVIVWQDGRLGLGIAKLQLANALFDPEAVLRIPAGAAAASKQGLVGRYLPVIDYGFSDAAGQQGWEEIAFATGQEELETHVCVRSLDGKRHYWRLPGDQPLPNGTEFYQALLKVQQKWEGFLTRGIRLELPDHRVSDAAQAAIVRALICQEGDHPKYGVGVYSGKQHDTFPPASILLNLCLLDWGFSAEAKARLSYYLSHFVKQDGSFDYYGPALSEYGQMLTLAAQYVRVTRDDGWLQENLPALRRIADYLLAEIEASRKRYSPGSPYYGLLSGSAEADTRNDKRLYFSGDVWCWRGLFQLGELLAEEGQRPGGGALEQVGENLLGQAAAFRGNVLAALGQAMRKDTTSPFLPPAAGVEKPFERMTESTLASYTNYRYWPEMLSSGMLPPEMRDALIAYRTSNGGEVAGTTRFEDFMDDWPFAHYAWGLLEAGQREHYLLGFFGHLALHQTPGTFTAYESVAIKGDSKRDYSSDYCVPSQLVVPQLLRWMVAWEPWDKQELWLARAVPNKWFDRGFSALRVPTRWGPLNLRVVPDAKGLKAMVELESPHPELRVHVRLGHTPAGGARKVTVSGTKLWKWDPEQDTLELWGDWKRANISLAH
ncbi:MAG: hypothetical protein ACLQVL_32060 [Terriglobia bacterium]